MRIKSFALLAIVATALIAAGCGSDAKDSSMTASSSTDGKANATDAMFVAAMIPHHESAVEMAQLGLKNAQRTEIKELSQSIIDSQTAEITEMKKMQSTLPSTSESMMSESDMSMMDSSVASLENAKDFDKAFIDAMIPHHRSAIMMAKRELANGGDPATKELAQAIVKAQTKEIAEMQAWRKAWYGAELPEPSPSSSMEGMH